MAVFWIAFMENTEPGPGRFLSTLRTLEKPFQDEESARGCVEELDRAAMADKYFVL
jgi:hypothetical protein